MDLQSFQEYMAEKPEKDKLLAMIEQMDNYAADKANARDAFWRRNLDESDYWQREAQAMQERILWLGQEIAKILPDTEDDYPVCMACGHMIDQVEVLVFNHDGTDSWYRSPIFCDKPTGGVSIKTSRNWTAYDDYEHSYVETIRCPLCKKHPFDTEAGCEIYQPVEVVMWTKGEKANGHMAEEVSDPGD